MVPDSAPNLQLKPVYQVSCVLFSSLRVFFEYQSTDRISALRFLIPSQGGAISILTACERPTDFAGVVLIAPMIQMNPDSATPFKVALSSSPALHSFSRAVNSKPRSQPQGMLVTLTPFSIQESE